MSERRPYSRVYWSIQHDAKFDGIREDMRLIGAWVTLLVIADQTWPAPCYPPPIVPKATLRVLSEAGLVDLLSGGRFRVHGLESERRARADAATREPKRDPSGTQAGPKRDAVGSLEEKRREEKSKEEARASSDDDDRPDLEAYLLLTRHAPTERQRRLLDGLMDRHDLTGPSWAADIMFRNPTDPIGAVIEADKAWRAERIAEAQAAEKPKPVARRKPGLPQSARDILAELKRLDAETGDAA